VEDESRGKVRRGFTKDIRTGGSQREEDENQDTREINFGMEYAGTRSISTLRRKDRSAPNVSRL